MLAADVLDALFVCTPPVHHAAPAIAALAAASRSISRSRSRAPLPTARRSSRPGRGAERSARSATSGARWTCWTSCAQLLGDARPGLLVSRSFGPTEGARHDLERGAAWFADPAASGGLLFELASHDIDLQIALAGPVESVQATGGQRPARARRPPVERAGRRRLGAPQLHERRYRRVPRRLEHRAVPAALRPRRAGADAALQLVLDPVFELRGRARGAESRCAGPSTRASRRSPVSSTPCAEAIPPGALHPRATRSPPCAPCSPASRRSRAASGSPSSLLRTGFKSRVALGGLESPAGLTPVGRRRDACGCLGVARHADWQTSATRGVRSSSRATPRASRERIPALEGFRPDLEPGVRPRSLRAPRPHDGTLETSCLELAGDQRQAAGGVGLHAPERAGGLSEAEVGDLRGRDVQRRAVEDAVRRALVRARSPRAPRPRGRAR